MAGGREESNAADQHGDQGRRRKALSIEKRVTQQIDQRSNREMYSRLAMQYRAASSAVRSHMDHRGIEFSVVQSANPFGWVWTVHLPGNRENTGRSRSRPLAVARALAVIDDEVANAVAARARES